MKKGIFTLIAFIALSFWLNSCATIGYKLGNGAIEGVLTDSAEFNNEVNHLLNILNVQSVTLRDSLLGKYTNELLQKNTTHLFRTIDSLSVKLRDTLLDDNTRKKIKLEISEIASLLRIQAGLLRDDMLGSKSQMLIASLRNELFGDTTISKIINLRNRVFDSTGQAKVDAFLDNITTELAKDYKEKLDTPIQNTLNIAKGDVKETLDNIERVLFTAGGLLVGLIVAAIFLIRAIRHKRSLQVVTAKITELEDTNPLAYEELTNNIKKSSMVAGTEPHLNKFLKANNMIKDKK